MSEENLGHESPAHRKNFEKAKLAAHEAIERIFSDYEMQERWYDNYGLTSPVEIVRVEVQIESEDGVAYDTESESIVLPEGEPEGEPGAHIGSRIAKEFNLIEILADL